MELFAGFQVDAVVIKRLDDRERLDAVDSGGMESFAAVLELFLNDESHSEQCGACLTAHLHNAAAGVAEGKEVIKENDGVCVFVSPDEEPDYIVKSVNNDYSPKLFTLERRVAYGGK